MIGPESNSAPGLHVHNRSCLGAKAFCRSPASSDYDITVIVHKTCHLRVRAHASAAGFGPRFAGLGTRSVSFSIRARKRFERSHDIRTAGRSKIARA